MAVLEPAAEAAAPRAGLRAAGFAVAGLAALWAAGAVMPDWVVYTATISLAKGIVVLGLLALLRMGLVSFGHAMYYCIGAYACGLLSTGWGVTDAFVLVVSAGVAAALAGFLLGLVLSANRGVFFAMFNLAVSMILYGALLKSFALGGSDGFGLPAPSYLGWMPDDADRSIWLYMFTALAATLTALAIWTYNRSQLGVVSLGVKDNEIRLEYLGMNPRRLVLFNYTIAAGLGGLGGGLVALASGHIIPELAFWTTSGEFVFMTVLSGPGSVVSAFIGTAVFEVVRLSAGQYLPNGWQLLLGGFLLVVIMFLPGGIASIAGRFSSGKAKSRGVRQPGTRRPQVSAPGADGGGA